MKINLIILASGNSVRFKGKKLLANLNGRPLYTYTLDKIESINDRIFKFNKIIVVTQYDEIDKYSKNIGFEVIKNDKSYLGLSHSIELGINVDLKADGYMFLVCDQPYLSKEIIVKTIESFILSEKGICSVAYNNILGNPNIFDKKYIEELCSLDGDIGGKAVIKNHFKDLDIVQVKNEIELKDIDTRDDL